MHKVITKTFNFFRNFFYFFKIVSIFLVLMLLFYWVQNLIDGHFGWLDFIAPVLGFIVHLGSLISNNSIDLFGAIFEYSYFFAIVIILGFFYLMNLFIWVTNLIEQIYLNGRDFAKKVEEKVLNPNLAREIRSSEKKLKIFKVYIATTLKKSSSHLNKNVDLDEQNKILNKFLIEKTGTSPVKYGKGFLYTFNNFDNIDSVLENLFKILNSKAPINYTICIQITGEDANKEDWQLQTLIGLNFINKISTFADTAYRYSFVEEPKYKVSQLGIYQKDNVTLEAQEFVQNI